MKHYSAREAQTTQFVSNPIQFLRTSLTIYNHNTHIYAFLVASTHQLCLRGEKRPPPPPLLLRSPPKKIVVYVVVLRLPLASRRKLMTRTTTTTTTSQKRKTFNRRWKRKAFDDSRRPLPRIILILSGRRCRR